MRIASLLFLALLQIPIALHAQPRVLNVIELFTSQGCSACPPADRHLQRIKNREKHVLVLSWHVDYWDYMGWQDTLADPRHTQRQIMYSKRHGVEYVYTPQFIFNGHFISEGLNHDRVGKMLAQKPAAALKIKQIPAGIELRLSNAETSQFNILAVRYTPFSKVHVQRGENSGGSLEYVNSVNEHKIIARWNAASPLILEDVRIAEDSKGALLVQNRETHEIIGCIDNVAWR